MRNKKKTFIKSVALSVMKSKKKVWGIETNPTFLTEKQFQRMVEESKAELAAEAKGAE